MWRSAHDRTVHMPTWQTEWNLLGCSCWVSLESCHGRPVSGAGFLLRSQWCWDETTWNENKMTCSAKTSRQLRKYLTIKNMWTLLVNVGGKRLTKLLVQLFCFIFITTVLCNTTWRRFEAFVCAQSSNTFDGLDEPLRPTPGGRKRRLDKENHKK